MACRYVLSHKRTPLRISPAVDVLPNTYNIICYPTLSYPMIKSNNI